MYCLATYAFLWVFLFYLRDGVCLCGVLRPRVVAYVLRRDVMMARYMLLPRCLSGRLSVTRREARRLKASSVITQSTARKMTPPATDCRLAAGNMYARSTGFCCGWSDGLQLSIFPTISERQNQALAVSSFY